MSLFLTLSPLLEQEVTLRHRQDVGRFAADEFPVHPHLIVLRIDLQFWRQAIMDHILLADCPYSLDRDQLLLQLELSPIPSLSAACDTKVTPVEPMARPMIPYIGR